MAANKKEISEDQGTQQSEQVQESDLELDLDNLDLQVEAIDERVSPSETNVFDK